MADMENFYDDLIIINLYYAVQYSNVYPPKFGSSYH